MRIALHPYDEKDISADVYSQEFGKKTTDANVLYVSPQARCKTCRNRLNHVAAATNMVAHFRHSPGVYCPTKFETGRPYVNLTPRAPNKVAGAAIRFDFKRLWKWHYKIMKTNLLPFMGVDEFLSLIRIATENRSWEYAGLTQELIPNTLVLMADFPPWTGYVNKDKVGRKLWFRFWYEHKMTDLSDLWITKTDQVLHRASFQPPSSKRGRPEYSDLVVDKILPKLPDFLTCDEPQVPPYVVKAVESWFSNNLDF